MGARCLRRWIDSPLLNVNEIYKRQNIITNFKLYKAPLKGTEENFIRENQNSFFFLNQKNWI